MPMLPLTVVVVGLILILLGIAKLESQGGIASYMAMILACWLMVVGGIALVVMLNKSHTGSCNQIKISANGISCIASKGKGK